MTERLELARHAQLASVVVRRSRLRAALRIHLDAQGYVEADPPPLLPHAGQEPCLQPPAVRVPGLPGSLWLQTSPELCLRRLVCAGMQRVYALGYAFRGGREELSQLHQPQFTLLEWYRPGTRVQDLMDDVLELGEAAAVALGVPAPPVCGVLSVAEALTGLAGCDPAPLFAGDGPAFAASAREAGVTGCRPDDPPLTLLGRLLVERIEPALRQRRGWTFLHDYPRCAAALARVSTGDPATAMRVEAYLNGVEIANGWVELDDAAELRRRWAEEAALRDGDGPPPAEALLTELAASDARATVGMALGVDRLHMALMGASRLTDVLAFHLALSVPSRE